MPRFHMRFPEGRNRALTLSYDDGVESDARLIEIMQKHGLKGTFNLNSDIFAPEGKTYEAGTIHRPFSRSRALECYRDSGMEVAVHEARHPFCGAQAHQRSRSPISTAKKQLHSYPKSHENHASYL